MRFVQAVASAFKKYWDFKGRSSRSEFWCFFTFIPSLFLLIRLLHDTNRSGWLVFVPITIVGIPFYFYWLVKKSDDGINNYGAPPFPKKDVLESFL